MVWVKPFQLIMTRWLKNRNSYSRLCERCVFLSTCKWCTRCVCLFLFLLRGASNTGRQHDHGRRRGGHQRGEIWTLRTFLLLLGSVHLFRCAPPRTLFSSISQSRRLTMVEPLGFSFLGNMTRYWQHALCKLNFKRFHHCIDMSLGGTLPKFISFWPQESFSRTLLTSSFPKATP